MSPDVMELWDIAHLIASFEHDHYFLLEVDDIVYAHYGKIMAYFHAVLINIRNKKHKK